MTEYIVQVNGEEYDIEDVNTTAAINVAIQTFYTEHNLEPIEFIWIKNKAKPKTDKEKLYELEMELRAAKDEVKNLTQLLIETKDKNTMIVEKEAAQ